MSLSAMDPGGTPATPPAITPSDPETTPTPTMVVATPTEPPSLIGDDGGGGASAGDRSTAESLAVGGRGIDPSADGDWFWNYCHCIYYLWPVLLPLVGWIMTLLRHFLEYLLAPRVLFAHSVGGGLLYALLSQGATLVDVVRAAILEELVSYLLWWIFPNTLGTIASLVLCIYLYEQVLGPRVVVRDNAKLLTDIDISDDLTEACPGLKFDLTRQGPKCYVINTFLRYALYDPSAGGKQTLEDPEEPIYLDDVTGVRPGYDYRISRAIRTSGGQADHCFQLLLEAQLQTISVIAPDAQTRDEWLQMFQQFVGLQVADLYETWLEKVCRQLDLQEEKRNKIALCDVTQILETAKRPTHKPYFGELFKGFAKQCGVKSVTDDSVLDHATFVKFFSQATQRHDIVAVYESLLDKDRGEMLLSAMKFQKFVKDEQKESVSTDVAKSWLRESETILPSFNLTSVGFTNYLLKEEHSIFQRECGEVYQDMRQPLCHYFIATSHNTYLTKDQLKGKSSVDAYVSAFKRGCKCVELDCWDGPNNEPIIYHGHTLTSKILFKDVISAIRDYAFKLSDYPVILSFENHCSVEQQKVMASHLVDILGDKLYTKPIPEAEKRLPSPEELKNYVIVKNKKLKAGGVTEEGDDDYSDDEITEEELEDVETASEEGEDTNHKSTLKNLLGAFKSIRPKRHSDKEKKSEVPKIAQELSDLVSYCQATTFKGFQYSKENSKHYEMSSFGEKKAMKFAKEECQSFLEYNARQMSRIYPAAGRVDSSNYDPQVLWNVGCQLVALNYQTADRAMQLNQGLFRDNGGCGYVLKPDFMRQDIPHFDPRSSFSDQSPKQLDIKIISGHQLPYSSEKSARSDRSLQVQLRISGVESDVQKEKTKSVKNNGFNPEWNEQMSFKLHVPEMAFLQFVLVESGSTLAQYALPVRCIQQGYRQVPLMNKASDPMKYSALFVHVEIKTLVNGVA